MIKISTTLIINRYINGVQVHEEELNAITLDSPELERTIKNVQQRFKRVKTVTETEKVKSNEEESGTIRESFN